MKIVLLWSILVQAAIVHGQTNFGKTIIISEIMADPTPPVSLPAVEYIELYNASVDTINLSKWTIIIGNSSTIINRTILVPPGRFVICCSQTMVALFDSTLQSVGLSSFPSFDNEAALIQIVDAYKNVVHAVAYHKNWYKNPVKENGGWSLEMIDLSKPCMASENWIASTDPSGGTPGRLNSVTGGVMDETPPRLLRAFCRDSVSVIALFDETLDVLSSSQPMSFTISNRNVLSATPLAALFNTVLLIIDQPLQKGVEHSLEVRSIRDCSGNAIGGFGKVKVGWPDAPVTSGMVINELLFNPATGGSDYVELYNGSGKLFDLKDLFLASRNATNALQSVTNCSVAPRLIFPGDHFVFTTDASYVLQHFLVKEPGNLIELAALPSMPDNEGTLVLLTNDNRIIDELEYSEKWHFPLLNKTEGVSLERIAFHQPSDDPSNWTSAAGSAGFGTPTYRNSQIADGNAGAGTFRVVPVVFSPDGDGIHDFTLIEFALDQPGMMGSITIFDIRGRTVQVLVNNSSLAQSGTFRWDGLDMHQRRAAPGMYIVMMDVFNLKGVRKKYKAAVVVAEDDQ